jgi:hypothetical protein
MASSFRTSQVYTISATWQVLFRSSSRESDENSAFYVSGISACLSAFALAESNPERHGSSEVEGISGEISGGRHWASRLWRGLAWTELKGVAILARAVDPV